MRFLATVVALAIAGAAGCTAHNPSYGGDGGGGGVGVDLGGPVDLLGPMGSCSVGERKCAGTVASDRCEAGMFVVDRSCPPGSSCMSSYCAPPVAMFGTQIGARCDANGGPQQLQCMASPTAMLSCQPFVEPGTMNVRWFCDKGVGPGRATSSCTRASECRSGLCDTTSGHCIDTCQHDQDCQTTGGTFTCVSFKITVEGVTLTVKGCG